MPVPRPGPAPVNPNVPGWGVPNPLDALRGVGEAITNGGKMLGAGGQVLLGVGIMVVALLVLVSQTSAGGRALRAGATVAKVAVTKKP